MFISNANVSTRIYDKSGDFDFEIIPRSTSYGVYIYGFRASDHVADLQLTVNSELLEKSICIINYAKRFLTSIADTMIRYLNSTSDLNLSYARDFQNQSFMAI